MLSIKMSQANKTRETRASVDAFLAKVKPLSRRQDCETLRAMMASASGEPARMWGPSIVGFGVRHYRYESGREGEICKVGFSPRARALVLYGVAGPGTSERALAALGTVETGKGCLYINKLGDVDLERLTALIRRAVEAR
jgi:Domain of unknown function (DU1801)